MRTSLRAGVVGLALGLAGCTVDGEFRDPVEVLFPSGPARPDVAKAPPASAKVATRVHAVGSEVIAANKADFRTKPIFTTVGVQEPMIFHRRSGDIIVSEGLVERCASDAELAAALCHELGKMAAERGDRSAPRPERDLPPPPPPSSDVVGSGQQPDMTRAAEEAKFTRRPRTGAREPRPDPRTLAQNYLTRTGYSEEDLNRLEPLLREAEENAEKREIMRGR